MLLTDDDYPQGFGVGGVLYYVIPHAGAQPVWFNGYNEATYRVDKTRLTLARVQDITGRSRHRVAITPELARAACDMWRQLYAPD